MPFLGCLFPAENKFWCIIFGKITSSHITLHGIEFDQISLTWLEFWMAVTTLVYTFSMASKF